MSLGRILQSNPVACLTGIVEKEAIIDVHSSRFLKWSDLLSVNSMDRNTSHKGAKQSNQPGIPDRLIT